MPEYLIDLEWYQKELERICAEFDEKIAELQENIIGYLATVSLLEEKVANLEAESSLWRARRDGVRPLLSSIAINKAQRFESFPEYGKRLEYYILSGEAELAYLSAWNLEAIEEIVALKDKFQKALEPPTFWHDIRGIREDEFQDLLDEATVRGEVVPTPAPWWPSKHDFNIHKWHDIFVKYVTELAGRGESEIAVHLREVYGVQYMPWIYPDAASIWRSELSAQEALASTNYEVARANLLDARDHLETMTRALRDKKLALENILLAKRSAIALWQVEYQAAQARKRIELDSIIRDVMLNYPAIETEIARGIAEIAYNEALVRGFERLVDALAIAMDLADEWIETHIFPHFTRQTVICSDCGSTLELIICDIEDYNRDLLCPNCTTSVGRGVSVILVQVAEHYTTKIIICPDCAVTLEITVSNIPQENTDLICPSCGASIGKGVSVRILAIAGWQEWLKKNWPYLAVGGLATGLIITLAKRRK